MPKKTMSHTLYLTGSERAAFEKLPASLREGMKVTEETLDAYETEEELQLRRDMFPERDPEYQTFLKKLEKLGEHSTLEDLVSKVGTIPHRLHGVLFFTLGAVFLRDCIGAMVPAAKTDDDVAGLALLSDLRHRLLKTNAEVAA